MRGIVALVGRPNVGKSTLFNRLVAARTAIVDDQPGVTRDRNYGIVEWSDREFTVIDTGGYLHESPDVFAAAIREQVEIALNEADIVCFLVDAKDGLHPDDFGVSDLLRRRKTKAQVCLVLNKADTYKRELDGLEFYELGLDPIFPISAMSGSGTGELMEWIRERLPAETEAEDMLTSGIPKLAIVGKPNVGKSSLVNSLLGRTQQIVTEVAGTTRDSISSRYTGFGLDFFLVDTAGLRKKARVDNQLEFYSTIRTLKAIEQCDVALVMLDATQGIESQDLNVVRAVERHRKGLVVMLNKWDLVEQKPGYEIEYRKLVEERLQPLSGVPIFFVSAINKVRILKALQAAQGVYEDLTKIIPTRKLNDDLLPIFQNNPPPSERGLMVRIKFITQTPARTPTFLLFANHPKHVKEHYKRFCEKQIRALYGFQGCPINIFFRES